MPLPVLLLAHIWLAPVTALGYLAAILGGARFLCFTRFGVALYANTGSGLVGVFFRHFFVAGYTWGAVVVLERTERVSERRLLAHELEHVRHGFRWGPLFPLAYAVASLLSAMRGTGWYTGNRFEVAARAAGAAAMIRESLPESQNAG